MVRPTGAMEAELEAFTQTPCLCGRYGWTQHLAQQSAQFESAEAVNGTVARTTPMGRAHCSVLR